MGLVSAGTFGVEQMSYYPTRLTLERISDLLEYLRDYGETWGGTINSHFSQVEGMRPWSIQAIKRRATDAGLISKTEMPFMGTHGKYAITERGYRFLTLVQQVGPYTAWSTIQRQKRLNITAP